MFADLGRRGREGGGEEGRGRREGEEGEGRRGGGEGAVSLLPQFVKIAQQQSSCVVQTVHSAHMTCSTSPLTTHEAPLPHNITSLQRPPLYKDHLSTETSPAHCLIRPLRRVHCFNSVVADSCHAHFRLVPYQTGSGEGLQDDSEVLWCYE